MTTTVVGEIIERDGDYSIDSRTATRRWTIKATTPAVNNVQIGAALIGTSLPEFLDPHPNNSFLTCRRLRIVHADGLWWRAEAFYDTRPLTQDEREKDENPDPLDRAVKISWGGVATTKVFVEDVSGDPIVNSAGDPFDPPPEEPWEALTFNFRQNFATPPTWMVGYLNSVNDDEIEILGITIAAGAARFTNPQGGELEEENGVQYYPASWSIECSSQSWQLKLLDEGLRQKDGSDRVVIVDTDDNPVPAPVPLDGNGEVLDDPTPANAVVLDFDIYAELDYTDLPGVSEPD